MKKHRRQELQTNILADRLGGAIQRIGPYLKTLGIVLAVAVVGLGGLLVVEREQSALGNRISGKSSWPYRLRRNWLNRVRQIPLVQGHAWNGSLSAYLSVAADLEALAKANQGAPAVGWIRSAAGDALLSVGMRQLYSDQPEARLTFLRAKAVYEDLMGAATDG